MHVAVQQTLGVHPEHPLNPTATCLTVGLPWTCLSNSSDLQLQLQIPDTVHVAGQEAAPGPVSSSWALQHELEAAANIPRKPAREVDALQ